ncbi:Smr/MutS family protein [Polynucleobacter sp. AP-Jannik-300A-C4]|uniref:Smr/MutS family protein n=1 Tax=Polynucleobacter sp. AP-Jannik-300A-C4 TaxID=2576928 RepID=UPI001BFD31B7|nr:Smr/MutS family protein [Polynucleobacter sp. AP-Jannik-300A-C4]QWE23503.1 Smr/MutS family protein [Polynucleobacter sp. AP-Jannik-300A-C4]
MVHSFECPECGNPRGMLGECRQCGSEDLPIPHSGTMVMNLKFDSPSAEEALDRLTIGLRRASEVGIKAMILIHGYGASGEGGKIKRAVHNALNNNYFSDRVDEYHFGEQTAFGSEAYHALLRRRPGLKAYLKHFKEGNAGMTVLLL